MSKVRVIRVIEYIGPEDVVKESLKKRYIQGDIPIVIGLQSIRELVITLEPEYIYGEKKNGQT